MATRADCIAENELAKQRVNARMRKEIISLTTPRYTDTITTEVRTMAKPETFGTSIARLTDSEANALRTHLAHAGDESFAENGQTDTVRELDSLTRYIDSARSNVLGTGKPYVKPATPLDHAEIAHESLFGALDANERHAFAVHMVHAWEESTHAGAGLDMQGDLMALANDADYAATAEFTPSGLVKGRTARKPLRSIAIGSPAH